MLVRALFVFVLCVSTPVRAEMIRNSQIGFGNWSGGAYSDDTTGAFSHCVISGDYVSGLTLLFSVNADSSVGIGLTGPEMEVVVGETFPVELTVDRRASYSGIAEAVSSSLIVFKIDDLDGALSALRKGFNLNITSGTFQQSFELVGTYRALEQVLDCAVYHYNRDKHSLNESVQKEPEPETDRTILFQIATSMISGAGATDFRYLNKDELVELNFNDAVVWTSDSKNIVAGVSLSHINADFDLRDQSALAIQSLTSSCAGDAATSSTSAAVGEMPGREIRVVCVHDSETSETIFKQIVVEERLLEVFFVFDVEDQREDGAAGRKQIAEDASLTAASMLLEIE